MIPSEGPISGSTASTWLSVSDELLWGFNHALSNRLAAITSIAKILEYSDTGLDPLLSALATEMTALEDTVKLLRLVPRDALAQPEPVLLEDLVPEAIRLHRLRSDSTDLEFETVFEGEPQPVWIRPGRLAHAILIALAAVSREAIASGIRHVRVQGRTSDDVVAVTVSSTGAFRGGTLEGSTEPERGAVCRLVADAGGECVQVDGETGGRGVEIRLPTLVAVRRRERGEATNGR